MHATKLFRQTLDLLFVLGLFLLCAGGLVLAQGGEPAPPTEPMNWLAYGALALNAVLVPLAADALKRVWYKAPSWVKTFVPLVAGSLFMLGEAKLAEFFGVPIDLGLIEQVFLGAGGGVASTLAFKWGEAHARFG